MYECEWVDMNCTVYGSKCKAPIHTLDPQAIHSHEPYIPKGYDPYPWSKTVKMYLYLRNKSGSNLLYDVIRNSLVPYFRIPVERSIHIHSIPLFLSHTQNILVLYYILYWIVALCRPRWKFALVSGPWPWMTLPLCCRRHCLKWWHWTRPSKQRVNSWRMCLGNSWVLASRRPFTGDELGDEIVRFCWYRREITGKERKRSQGDQGVLAFSQFLWSTCRYSCLTVNTLFARIISACCLYLGWIRLQYPQMTYCQARQMTQLSSLFHPFLFLARWKLFVLQHGCPGQLEFKWK